MQMIYQSAISVLQVFSWLFHFDFLYVRTEDTPNKTILAPVEPLLPRVSSCSGGSTSEETETSFDDYFTRDLEGTSACPQNPFPDREVHPVAIALETKALKVLGL